jgi:acyl-CoA reductase-like NAD-dependent aldehyde dehydrogenase
VRELSSIVDGRPRPGPERALDHNPARPSDVLAETRLADAQIAGEAAAAARAAFSAWRSASPADRGDVLRRAGDRLERDAAEIGCDLAREEGKTLAEAIGETLRAAAILRYYGGQTFEPDGEVYPSANAATLLYSRREPIGVVVALTPWNFPLAIPAWKLAPALAFGNTVVWKPAELVPLTSLHLFDAIVAAGLPPGVLNLVLGRGAVVGPALVAHPDVSAITFTGSNRVGRDVQLESVRHGKKVQLELGGKNPAIVLADADLEHAAEQVARGAFLSAGQKCTATSRVIVDRSVHDELAARVATLARSWKVGDPLDAETKVGPLVSDVQLDTVLGYLDRAREERATVHAGGGRADQLAEGYFVEPTVLSGLGADSAVVREEIFGPVAALLSVDGYEEALVAANDTPFGLTAALFTRDLGTALRFTREIRAGVVKVNQETAGLEFHVPFGGMKESSSGSREQGKVARDFFTDWKTVYMDPA